MTWLNTGCTEPVCGSCLCGAVCCMYYCLVLVCAAVCAAGCEDCSGNTPSVHPLFVLYYIVYYKSVCTAVGTSV